jgi:hypothetical protein
MIFCTTLDLPLSTQAMPLHGSPACFPELYSLDNLVAMAKVEWRLLRCAHVSVAVMGWTS